MQAVYGGNVISQEDALSRSEAYWGPGVRDGSRVNIKKAQEIAQERFLTAMTNNPNMKATYPLEDLIDPISIRKAILDPTYTVDMLTAEIRKAQETLADNIASIRKATDSNSSLIHTTWDNEVTQLFQRLHPLQALIDVEACMGKWAAWDAIGPTGNGTAAYVGEDPVIQHSDIQTGDRIEPIKIAMTSGKITQMGEFVAGSQTPARDLMGIRTEASNEALRELKDRGYLGITRDVTQGTTAYEAASPLAFPGLHELIHKNTADPNWIDVSAATVNSLATLEPYIDDLYLNMLQDKLRPNLMTADFRTFSMIRRDLNKFFMSENMKETDYGIQVLYLTFSQGRLPVIPFEILPSAHGANGEIQMLDTTKIAYRQGWGPMFQMLGNQNGSKEFMINEAGTIIDRTDINGTSSLQGAITGITI
jgi:hypothetical protein